MVNNSSYDLKSKGYYEYNQFEKGTFFQSDICSKGTTIRKTIMEITPQENKNG